MHTPIAYLPGVGPQRAELLQKEMGWYTVSDVWLHFPYRHLDRSVIHTIKDINEDSSFFQLRGHITGKKIIGERNAKRLVATFTDGTGVVELVWFKGQKWMSDKLKLNAPYLVFGKPKIFNYQLNFPHPDIEEYTTQVAEQLQVLPWQPMYNTTEKMKSAGIDSKFIQKVLSYALAQNSLNFAEVLPVDIADNLKLIPINTAIKELHFPTSNKSLQLAQFRIKFEELFIQQVKILRLRHHNQVQYKGFIFDTVGTLFNTLYKEKLPFDLTEAQKRVVREIRQNTLHGKQMNRLIQGDVGSGKTVVALLSILLAIDNGFQTALMAPTEILANQHYATILDLLKGLPVNVKLLTGSTKVKERREIDEMLQAGTLHLLIGTHALIEDKVQFSNLGLVVIDEQHRFGVAQRSKLWKKNSIPPHVLVMTATPIPRTLTMTLYGDLDVSIINELPPGRKPIFTYWRTETKRMEIWQHLKSEVDKGRQAYVVYPLINESEKLDFKHLTEGYDMLRAYLPYPDYTLGMVHGKLSSAEKDAEMQKFIAGKTNILVATTVIEVGVNVPNATTMVIESAERFGLSQLHQLRGRVGRGGEQSYCILLTGNKVGEDSRERMHTMVRTQNGFEIAEVDLRMRGPGDIFGTKQSGIVDLKLADLIADQPILTLARDAATALLNEDPTLSLPAHITLHKALDTGGVFWEKVS